MGPLLIHIFWLVLGVFWPRINSDCSIESIDKIGELFFVFKTQWSKSCTRYCRGFIHPRWGWSTDFVHPFFQHALLAHFHHPKGLKDCSEAQGSSHLQLPVVFWGDWFFSGESRFCWCFSARKVFEKELTNRIPKNVTMETWLITRADFREKWLKGSDQWTNPDIIVSWSQIIHKNLRMDTCCQSQISTK